MLDCLCVLSLLKVNKNIRHLCDFTGLFFATPIMTVIGILIFSWKYTMHCYYSVFVSNLVCDIRVILGGSCNLIT